MLGDGPESAPLVAVVFIVPNQGRGLRRWRHMGIVVHGVTLPLSFGNAVEALVSDGGRDCDRYAVHLPFVLEHEVGGRYIGEVFRAVDHDLG